ncbi:Beta-porphyranase B [Gracilariopsis chorda]|uniref:Beta-porphyranase B n=1 Tax=Gracilariopsis chorda TaxID=448386 RepID=A0A2V3ISP4_9FLOR|nr:Beta-porphyranase B [Gracilariopsis chorda]|eukprot:PXF45119.1 Beta-porphyranase B [Gracilariopsis chorda]
MSRFLGCGCPQRPLYEVEPCVWAGRSNGWEAVPELTDEFRANSLDLRKWFPYSPFSFGTKPGLFVPSNVSVSDQKAWLTPKREMLPDDAPGGYEGWTTGALVSQYKQLYGYFECSFKASDTALASRFMLVGKRKKKRMSVDVFSYSAHEENKELVFMDALFATKDEDGKAVEAKHPLKKIILDMPDHPVTVGIDWTPDHLKTYVDGHVIRNLENKYWHSPMQIGFFLETIPDRFGVPNENQLKRRAAMEIYYVRTWQRTSSVRQERISSLDGEL